MKNSLVLSLILLSVSLQAAYEPAPEDVSRRIIGQFLDSQPCGYFPKGAGWARPAWTNHVHYSIVSLWVNAIECAREMGDRGLEKRLTDRFLPWFGEKKHLQCFENHVDFCVFGALPYEVYLSTGDRRALEMGASYADRQWVLPPKDAPIHCQNLPYDEQAALFAKGYSPQTRYWIDDMYMIIFLQVQAYRATGDVKYLDRTAKEMVLYLDKLQKEDGLFDHAPDVPFVWGRGAGWMAGGMPLLLKYLPETNPDRPRILAGYRKMMAALLKWQRPNGLWGQLVTDPESWDETSGSAMFAYGFVMGVKYGWLDKTTYEPAAQKAWTALCGKLDSYGNLSDVCCGTAKKNDRAWYMERPRVLGDTHGQAPMLWLCAELLSPVRIVTSLSGKGWMLDGQSIATVPHSWNGKDVADGPEVGSVPSSEHASVPGTGYLKKVGVYSRDLPDPEIGYRTVVRFEGVSIKAIVRVNGHEVGRHAGAFTPFAFDVTSELRPHGNVLEVEVDNRYDPEVPPADGDFSMSGGIYRDVWLVRAPVGLEFGDGLFVDEREATVNHPHYEFRTDGFYVDGVRRVLRGVNYHQDGPTGWVLSAEQEEADIKLIAEMGANAIRTCHYPRSRRFYDLCRKYGILVWTEVPAVDCITPGTAFEENLLTAAKEMVLNFRTCPNIAVWGLYNELYLRKMPDGTAEPLVEKVRDLIKSLDPSRPTVAASCKIERRWLNDIPDGLGVNTYPGWYGGKSTDHGFRLRNWMARNGRTTVALSEYGAGANVAHHENPIRGRPVANGPFHPEEYQTAQHIAAYRDVSVMTNIWGSFVWQMFDSAADNRSEGGQPGINDKGLVTRDRCTLKDAYYFYRANWTSTPTLHLCGTRMTTTTNTVCDVVGFSNLPGAVTLTINGRFVGEVRPDPVRTATWTSVPLELGENEIRLSAGNHSERWTLHRVDGIRFHQ